MPSIRSSRIHGLDIRVSSPTRMRPRSSSPIACPIAGIAGVLRGKAPARARIPSVPNSFISLTADSNLNTNGNVDQIQPGNSNEGIVDVEFRALLECCLSPAHIDIGSLNRLDLHDMA